MCYYFNPKHPSQGGQRLRDRAEEIIILLTLYYCFLWTEFVPKPEMRYFLGWTAMALIATIFVYAQIELWIEFI